MWQGHGGVKNQIRRRERKHLEKTINMDHQACYINTCVQNNLGERSGPQSDKKETEATHIGQEIADVVRRMFG